jgi:hypothetical protein
MARNLDEDNEEENKLANNIVSYFPILPSMQVTHPIHISIYRFEANEFIWELDYSFSFSWPG